MAVSRWLQERRRKIAVNCRVARDNRWFRQWRAGGGLLGCIPAWKRTCRDHLLFWAACARNGIKACRDSTYLANEPGTWEKCKKSRFCLAFAVPPGYNNRGMGWEVHPEAYAVCLACLTYESEGYVGLFKFIETKSILLLNLGEAAWSTGLPPSRSHHLAIFIFTAPGNASP